MKLYLIRHAQSTWQIEPGDDLDAPLTELGHLQAKYLGTWLVAHHRREAQSGSCLVGLRVSPLLRAQQTADYVARSLSLPLITQPSLREAEFHVADHLPTHPAPLAPPLAHSPSEAYATFKLQAEAAVSELVEQAEIAGGAVLAITHGGLIKTLLRRLIGSETVCFRLYNTGVCLVEWRRARWHLVYLNVLDHLPVESRTE